MTAHDDSARDRALESGRVSNRSGGVAVELLLLSRGEAASDHAVRDRPDRTRGGALRSCGSLPGVLEDLREPRLPRARRHPVLERQARRGARPGVRRRRPCRRSMHSTPSSPRAASTTGRCTSSSERRRSSLPPGIASGAGCLRYPCMSAAAATKDARRLAQAPRRRQGARRAHRRAGARAEPARGGSRPRLRRSARLCSERPQALERAGIRRVRPSATRASSPRRACARTGRSRPRTTSETMSDVPAGTPIASAPSHM